MPTLTNSALVLPSIELTKNVWEMGRVQLIQLLMYFWGLYQAMCGNYHALQADNVRLRELLASANKCAADSQKERCSFEGLVRESIQEYEEERGIFQNQLAALEAEIGELKTNAADAKNYLEELESYSNQLERKLNAMRAEKDAEAAIYYECNDDRWFTRSTEKRIFLKKETKALLKAKSDLEKSRKELSAFKSAVAKMLYDGLPVDCITQYSVISPVFVVPSLENVDPVILNRGSVLNLESRSQGGKPKFPGAQATTIEKIYQCSGLRNMVDSVRQVLTLCGVNLEEE